MANGVVLGLDIGTSRIKFVEARITRRGPLITNAGIGLTPQDAIANGVIVAPDVLGAAVRQILSEHGVRTKTVVSSVASQSSLVVRPIEVPRMTRQELASTMQWEVDRHIPFAATEVVMDFQPLVAPEQLPPEAQNMEVLLAVAQQDMIEAHVQTLFQAGLDPNVLDVEPLSACRSLIDINRDQGAYEQTHALLNIGATTTDLSVFRTGGLLTFTRPIPLAGNNITTAIADALGYEFHEAEQAKLNEGTIYVEGAPAIEASRTVTPAPREEPIVERAPSQEEEEQPFAEQERVFDLGAETPPPQRPTPSLPIVHKPGAGSPGRQVYDAMLPSLVELVTEIRRSLEYYANRYPDSRVDKILVFGGTARMPNFPEFLANEAGVPVELGNPFRSLALDESAVPPEIAQENACFMPIAVGLAIRDMIE